MSALDRTRSDHAALSAFRHGLHAHPELGMAEHRTAWSRISCGGTVNLLG